MPTIASARARLHTEQPNANIFPVAAAAAFKPGDLLKVTAGEINKLGAGGAAAVALALAVEKLPDAYWEPLGEAPTHRNAILLGGGVLVELNVSGVIAEANFNSAFGIIQVGDYHHVDLADTINKAFVPLRLADELYGGVLGDTNVRVVGYFLDSVCAGLA